MTGRIHQGVAWGRIKGATRMLFSEFGSLEAVAEILGISRSQAGRYQLADAADVITADKIAILEGQDGVRPYITQALAAINGHMLVPKPEAGGDAVWGGRLGGLALEAGALMQGLGRALSDGTITPEEVGRLGLRTDVATLQSTLASIDQALEQIQRQGEAPPKK